MYYIKTERAAMKVEDESKIKLVEYMIDKVEEEYEATIVGFSKRVFFETEEHKMFLGW